MELKKPIRSRKSTSKTPKKSEYERILEFTKYCFLGKEPWTGKPFKLFGWQKEWLQALYGVGCESIKKSHVFIGKKQGKSGLCSMLALYTAHTTIKGDILLIAGSKTQAKVLFDGCVDLIESSPAFNGEGEPLFEVTKSTFHIKHNETGSTIRVVSGKTTALSGPSTVLVICDEICEWERAYGRQCWNKVADSIMEQPKGKVITISTANFRRDVGYELYLKSKKILAGDDKDSAKSVLPVIYEVGEFEDWTKEENWLKALPALKSSPDADDGVVDIQYYRDDFASCKDNPVESIRFRTLLINQFCSTPKSICSLARWNSCKTTKTANDFKQLPCILAIDIGSRSDLCVYQKIFYVATEKVYYTFPTFFIPTMTMKERELRDGVPYSAWAEPKNGKKSNLVKTDGNVVDEEKVMQCILDETRNGFKVDKVYYDPYGIEHIRKTLTLKGFQMEEVQQNSNKMKSTPGFLINLLEQDRIRFPDCPILDWNYQNAIPDFDRFERAVLRKISFSNRIDGLTALCLGLSHWIDIGKQVEVNKYNPKVPLMMVF